MTDKTVGRQLMDLGPDDCRYPFGDASPYLFCGEVSVVGSSYCEPHRQICTKQEHGLGGRESPRFAALIRKRGIPKCLVVNEGAL